MDIIITDSALRKFLETKADAHTISSQVSLSGPTFDRSKKTGKDYIYEIEAITNRVDTACALGVAREAAIILSQSGIPAKLINDPYRENYNFPEHHPKLFSFDIDKDLIVRFTAIALENITVKPSPKSTQDLLESCGQRTLNNCIDITNELTLLYGLPSHIFDLDKLAAQKLTLRKSQKDESIVTLNGKKNILLGNDIVIEDGNGQLVDLCGVMGGLIAEVDDHTKNILLIVPVYEPRRVRQTSLYFQNRTLAAQIYEKQPDPQLCPAVMSQAIQLFKDRAGARPSSSLFDFYPKVRPEKTVTLEYKWLNDFVGVDIDRDVVLEILANLGFAGTKTEDSLTCTVPSWRYHDINIREDLAEEVARIYGYFRLPSSLPSVDLPVEPENPVIKIERAIKNYLSVSGFTEIYNSSLTSGDLLTKTGIHLKDCIKLQNSISRDFEYLRTSLIPSILENFRHNQGKQDTSIQLFEVANVYLKETTSELPQENSSIAAISAENFRHTKGRVEGVLTYLNVRQVRFETTSTTPSYFNPAKTAEIKAGNNIIGYLGFAKPEVLRALSVSGDPVLFELSLENLAHKASKAKEVEPIPHFPFMVEDLTIQSQKPLGEIIEIISETSKLIKRVRYLDSFENKHTFQLSFGSEEKNLEQGEINELKGIILKRVRG